MTKTNGVVYVYKRTTNEVVMKIKNVVKVDLNNTYFNITSLDQFVQFEQEFYKFKFYAY